MSHSTPEAEIVAGAFALRNTGLPGQVFWDTIAFLYRLSQGTFSAGGGRFVPASEEHCVDEWGGDVVPAPALGDGGALCFNGDNSAMIQVCLTGRNPTMRHLGRTHGISIT